MGGSAMKYGMGGLQTVGGAVATYFGAPEIGVPMMMNGVGELSGSSKAQSGLGALGALGGGLGGAMGGSGGSAGGSTTDAASAAGRMPSTDLMQSAMGGSNGGGGTLNGLSGMAPMLQKYGPMLASAGMSATPPAQPPQMQPPQMGRMAAQPAPINIPQAGAGGPPNPMSALQAYRSFLQQQTGG